MAEGEGDAGVFEVELNGYIDALAVDGLEGDGTVLTEDAGRGGEEEVSGGIEAGWGGEAEGDKRRVGPGGDVEIVFELGAVSFVEEVDAGIDAIETDGGEVGDMSDVGLTVEIVGDAGEGIDAGDMGGREAVGKSHLNDVLASEGGGDGAVGYLDGDIAAGGEEANIGGGLAAVGFEEEGGLIGRGGGREEGRGAAKSHK